MISILPAHGICLTGVPFIISATAFFNIVIAASYVALASVLFYLKSKIKKIPYVDTFLWLWIAFVFLCGLTHVSKVTILYVGGLYYYLDLIIHIITAVVSAASAFLMLYYKKNIFNALNSYMDADCKDCYDQSGVPQSQEVNYHKK